MSTGLQKTLRRQDVTFEEKDQALRDDVRTLGAMVGDLILEQNGEELFEMVEDARLRSIRRREDNEKPGEELSSLVADLEPETATQLVRGAWSGCNRFQRSTAAPSRASSFRLGVDQISAFTPQSASSRSAAAITSLRIEPQPINCTRPLPPPVAAR